MNDQNINEIEVERSQLDYAIKMGEAFEKLRDNPDFQVLMEQGYLTDNANRLVRLRGEGDVSPGFQERVLHEIDAIGYLASWFRTINSKYQESKLAMEQLQEEIEKSQEEME